MRHKFLHLFSCLLLLTTATAQNPPAGGIDLDDPGVETIQPLDMAQMKSFGFQDSVRLLKKPFVPGDQGELSACAAWSLRHLLMVQRSLERKAHVDLSASFLYNLLAAQWDDCNRGAKISDGLMLLKSIGTCPTADFSNSQVNCKPVPEPAFKDKAAPFRIIEYFRTFTSNADSAFKVNTTRFCLASDHPVVVAFCLTSDFEEYCCSYTWKPKGSTIPKWGHALVVVGYVNGASQSGAGYFELLNSFGDSCGKNGIVRVSYADFARLAQFGFVIYI